ncbi:hypothetical protein ALC57_06244 [Trachymyrmex cornetzi]|uniref:Uncharacterized protein n=1 Tax=Trachymyrmex cornetzi TaxID=471704 RepID=A0A195E909_9HYME|nr:hypothetical protein ALC57_06244 [Trachymyrmex cornetzi]
MLLNAPLIPFFLGIFANVSKESDFDPEYLFEVNKTVIEYRDMGKFVQTTQLNSTVTCHPFLMKSLQCDLHDVMISEYSNFTQTVYTWKRLEVEQSFEMDFNNCGLRGILEKNHMRMTHSLISDIGCQFNLFFDIRNHALNSSFVKDKTTSSGYICDITYDIDETHMRKNAFKETNSNFQIKLLTEDFSNQKDSHIYIVDNKTDCMSLGFHDFIMESEIVRIHIFFSYTCFD